MILGDCIDMTFGFAFKSADFSESPEDIRLLRGDNIGQGRLRWSNAKRFPKHRLNEVKRYLLQEGDVVIAMDRPWIEAGLKHSIVRKSDTPSLLVQRVARLRAKESLTQGYLAAIVASREFTDYVVGVQTGSAVPHISGGQIAAFTMPDLPSPAEQRTIAATLGVLDDKIESNRRIFAMAFDLLDTVAEHESNLLPSVSLGDLTSLQRTTTNPSGLGDVLVDHFSLPAFDAAGQPERVPASSIKSNKIDIVGKAILVSRLNPRINRTWWACPRPGVPALTSTEFAVLTAHGDAELAALWLAVRAPCFREELPQRVTGTSGSHQRVRPDDLLSIEVPDVRRLDQSTKLTSLNLLRLCTARRTESAGLAALRDALLPELLSGRLRVSHRELDSASFHPLIQRSNG